VLARAEASGSHVLSEMLSDEDLRRPSLRISLSHYNSKEDIDALMDALKVFKYKICFVTLAPKKRYYLGISQADFIFLHLHRYCFFCFPFSFYNYFPFLAVIINPSIIMIAVIKIT
jgi:hypothetical protein